MPKYRSDLSVAAFRIAEAIQDNDWSADPPRIRVDFVPIFGYEVLEVRRAFRIRLSFRKHSLARRKGKRNNRITIPASYLCLRWVDLSRDSPLWYLTEESDEVRQGKGIFYDQGEEKWKLLIYQVVEDMNHARRMFVHIFARYQRERSRKEALQREVERRVVEATVFGPGLSPAARQEMDQFQRWLGRRFEDMGRIGGKLGPRSDLVNFYASRIQSGLQGIAATLVADADNLETAGRFNPANLLTHLRLEQTKLDRFVSKNILSLRRQAQRRIDKAISTVEIDRSASATWLREAALKLQAAADEMRRWSDSVTAEEMKEAAGYRGMAV